MKKPTKKSLKNKLDKEISRITRARGICFKCGNQDYLHLETAHIFSRKNLAIRWDLRNTLCSCDGCHFWAHQNPILFTERIREYLGNYDYEQLKLKASMSIKWTVENMQTLLDALKTL